MSIRQLINLGSQSNSMSFSSRTQLINLISLFTFGISLVYTLTYVFVIKHPIVASINAIFTMAYLLTLSFSYYHRITKAKVWFFSVLMIHIVVCTNIYVTKESGFHLYFFLVPTGAFLLFKNNEVKTKVILSTIATLLFFYCENTINPTPLISLTAEQNHLLYQSVIFINMLEVIVVLTIFSNQLEKNELKLTMQAKTDALTGAANRHHFFEHGNTIVSQLKNHNRPLCIALLDIDNFKSINDKFGHHAGDRCLEQLTTLVCGQIREQDFFARIGGEEFVILLPDTTLNEANTFIERLRAIIEQEKVSFDDEKDINFTASFGLTCLKKRTDSLKDLLVSADNALYEAKNKGRNRVIIAS